MMGKVLAGGAADVPEPTTGPTLLSISNSETEKGQLAAVEVTQLGQHWTWK